MKQRIGSTRAFALSTVSSGAADEPSGGLCFASTPALALRRVHLRLGALTAPAAPAAPAMSSRRRGYADSNPRLTWSHAGSRAFARGNICTYLFSVHPPPNATAAPPVN